MDNNDAKESPSTIGGKSYEHPAFCTVSFSRISIGGTEGQQLFGSSISHNNVVSLKIRKADITRELHKDWIYGDLEKYIEVWLSPNKFAELLTTMNYGSGVAATLKYKEGKQYKMPNNLPTKAKQFKEESNEHITKILTGIKDVIFDIKNQNKAIGKNKQKEIILSLEKVQQNIKSNLAFILTQFEKQMQKSVVEAKAEISAFVDLTVRNTGLKSLKENNFKLLEDNKE